jgi:nucleotide-binding universal stress UspA family protein
MYNDILLPVDLADPSSWRKSLPVALSFCRTFGARLHVVTVVPDFGMAIVGQYFPETFERQMIEETRKALHAFVSEHVPPEVPVQHVVAHGTVYQEILHEANEIGVDLIVIASHRPELRDYLLGPNAARVVRHAGMSVLVVRE